MLLSSNEISPEDESKYQILQDGTLMIENASDSDMGSYECMAKSPAGEVKSRSVHMKPTNANNNTAKGTVNNTFQQNYELNMINCSFFFQFLCDTVKPKFTVTPEDVDAQDGSSARLSCQVVGHPRPVITWTFNDGPVDRQRTGNYSPRIKIDSFSFSIYHFYL